MTQSSKCEADRTITWPIAFVLAILIIAITITINSCNKMDHEGNLELMKEGIYGLTAQEASEIIHEKKDDNRD